MELAGTGTSVTDLPHHRCKSGSLAVELVGLHHSPVTPTLYAPTDDDPTDEDQPQEYPDWYDHPSLTAEERNPSLGRTR